MNNKSGEIELFRFIFSMIIIFRHSEYIFEDLLYFPGGAFGVEFFFLVSGCLLMASIDKIKNESIHSLGDDTLFFLKRKVDYLFPEVLISLSIAVVINSIANNLNLKETAKLICNSVFEFLLLSHSGLGSAPLVGVVWYLSTMLLSMMILYPLIRKYTDSMTKLVLPIVSIFILGFLIKNYGSFRNPSKWLFIGYKGFFRGFGEICLGAELYWVVKILRNLKITIIGKIVLSIIKWLSWGAVIVYTTKTTIKYDAFFLLVLCLAVIAAFSNQCFESRIYQNKLIYFLGKLSLPLYLNHNYIARNLMTLVPNRFHQIELLILYLLLTLFASIFVMLLSKIWRSKSIYLKRFLIKVFIE